MAAKCMACWSSADGLCAGTPRPCVPEPQPMVRHLETGTPCTVQDCEECALAWMLTGNIYLTVE